MINIINQLDKQEYNNTKPKKTKQHHSFPHSRFHHFSFSISTFSFKFDFVLCKSSIFFACIIKTTVSAGPSRGIVSRVSLKTSILQTLPTLETDDTACARTEIDKIIITITVVSRKISNLVKYTLIFDNGINSNNAIPIPVILLKSNCSINNKNNTPNRRTVIGDNNPSNSRLHSLHL